MKISKEEITEELASLQEIVRALRRRRRELQRQGAIRGNSVDPAVRIEIQDITAQIQEHEGEISTLEAMAAADQVPVEEIEYQAMLAEEWDKSSGRLKLAQRARRDWMRVRLGIALERAQAMEHAVRTQMAEEIFEDLNLSYLPHRFDNVPPPPILFDFDRLRKAILLDLPTAIRLFRVRLVPVQHIDIRAIEDVLMDPHSACRPDDAEYYRQFLDEVRAALV
jgi:hypothetical protein